MTSSRTSYRLTKLRYFESEPLSAIEECQCLLLTLCVLLEAVREKMKPTLGNKKTLRIGAK